MAKHIPLNSNTTFNPETGELSNTNSSNPAPSNPRNNSDNNNLSGIVLVFVILIIGTLVYFITTSKSDTDSKNSTKTIPDPPTQNNGAETNNFIDTTTMTAFNPFGSGNGKLNLYKTCEYCPDLVVYIDENQIGTLYSTYRNGIPICDDSATISTILIAGQHKLYAKDSYGTIWDSTITVIEGECKPQKISKIFDSKPNPYGFGNGSLTIYNTCHNCNNIKVYANDNQLLGTFTAYYNDTGTPSCGDSNYATINCILNTGVHKITAFDDEGNSWSGLATVDEGVCKLYQPENFKQKNPYGEGNGQATIFHTCTNCSNVRVYIDNYTYKGTLSRYYYDYSYPDCGINNDASISLVLSNGSHKITAEDDNGDKWSGILYIRESKCITYPLENFVKANPYGDGKGKISLWTNRPTNYELYIGNTYQTTLSFQGTINTYFPYGIPDCGQSGTLSLILPAGRYKYSAQSIYQSGWKGEFTVVEGKCNNFKINGD